MVFLSQTYSLHTRRSTTVRRRHLGRQANSIRPRSSIQKYRRKCNSKSRQHDERSLELQTQLCERRSRQNDFQPTTHSFYYYSGQVRITTKDAYTLGSLWIADVVHMPFGCSVPIHLANQTMRHTRIHTGMARILDKRPKMARRRRNRVSPALCIVQKNQ